MTKIDLLDENLLAQLSQEGRALHDERLKALLEPAHNGETIAIHLDTGDYALANNSPDASREIRMRHSEGLIMTTVVGPEQMDPLAYRMLAAGRAKRISSE
jgi:hypothetical protein